MGGMRLFIPLLAVSLLGSCKDATGDQKKPSSGSAKAPTKTAPIDAAADEGPEPLETTWDKIEQFREERKAEQAKKDGAKGDGQDEEWTPAEFKAGMARWKDVGVYVDGKPMGFLQFGELPIALKPTWVKDKVSAEKRPGTDDPGWRWAQQRFYRFDEYLKAIGVDVRQVKELHVYGPKLTQTLIVTAKDLRSPKVKDFLFRFGANTSGKPIGAIPEAFGNGKIADKISAVMVYLKKKPPQLVRNEGMFLDGVEQMGVPYFGDPIRGGVRVYRDDKLVAIIKRQELDAAKATKSATGALTWKLADVLAAQGVKLDGVAEMWVVRNELRAEKFPGTAIADMTFAASSQAKGGLELGPDRIKTNAIAFHSKPVPQEDIPAITPDDE